MTVERRERIRALNDRLRQTQTGGHVMATQGITGQGPCFVLAVLGALRRYDEFNDDNDPHGEHDFGSISIDGEVVFFKIDYYDLTFTAGADDPADEATCARVLTVMLAGEY